MPIVASLVAFTYVISEEVQAKVNKAIFSLE